MDLIYQGKNGTKIYQMGDRAYKTGKNIRREYNVLKKLSHPNIIKVFDCGISSDKSAFLLMEYFEGESLICPSDQQLEELKSAIEYIHSQGIKHNDLMGYNILSNGQTLKIIDFGNAGPAEKLAKDVEGCKREDWENYRLFEANNNELKRRVNHG